MSLRTTAATRFDSFNLYRTSYKKIGDHEIEVNVLVPKDLTPGKHPMFVKWHGGGLVSTTLPSEHLAAYTRHQTAGTAAYPDWFSGFLVPFLHRNNAIAILPNYRLTPEHTGDEIIEDVADFWSWFRCSLPTYIASKDPSVSLDFSKVLVHGESAGGWCALQSILILPQHAIKACLVQYPVLCAFPTSPDETPMGEAIPSKKELAEFLAGIVPGTVVSSSIPPARCWLATMLRAYRRWGEFFGTEKHLMPDTRIEDAEFFVPTYIIHGEDDSVVPVKWSHEFVEKARKKFPDTRFELVTPRGDHGFDGAVYEEDAVWLEEVLRGVEKDWLA